MLRGVFYFHVHVAHPMPSSLPAGVPSPCWCSPDAVPCPAMRPPLPSAEEPITGSPAQSPRRSQLCSQPPSSPISFLTRAAVADTAGGGGQAGCVRGYLSRPDLPSTCSISSGGLHPPKHRTHSFSALAKRPQCHFHRLFLHLPPGTAPPARGKGAHLIFCTVAEAHSPSYLQGRPLEAPHQPSPGSGPLSAQPRWKPADIGCSRKVFPLRFCI